MVQRPAWIERLVGMSWWRKFSEQFWPALIAGIFASILTGLIVGFIILSSQRNFDAQQLKRQCRRDLAAATEKIRGAIYQPGVRLFIGSAVESLPKPAADADKVMSELPISLWGEVLPEKKKTIDSMVSLRRTVTEFAVKANRLDTALRAFIRQYNAQKGVEAMNDSWMLSYCVGRIQGGQPEVVQKWVEYGNIPDSEELVKRAEEDSNVKPTIDPYLEAKNAVWAAIEALRSEL